LKEHEALSTRVGRLWVVATPIGNLEDLAPRAQRVLAEVDLVAAEDTRHTGKLLARLGVSRPLLSLHEHNESARVAQILDRMRQGQDVALVSDAGTPLVSDPGFRLVRAVRQAGFEVFPIPGPSAAIAALSVAGLPSDRFWFEGFLPASGSARRQRLEPLLALPVTVICYESSHRIRALADDLAALAPDREMALAREISKQFEEHFFGEASALSAWLDADVNRLRGEFVVVLGGQPEVVRGGEEAWTPEQERLLKVLLDDLPLKQAVGLASRLTGLPRNRVYARALEWTG
jgi:16S rRNA (cytidine1402-2'-O)-methyltransferase